MKINKAGIKHTLYALTLLFWSPFASVAGDIDYDQARWDPIHFKPAIDTATDEQCLACHKEVLEPAVKAESSAGVKASEALAWYQTLEVYEGEQETFHRRHMVTPLANRLMKLQCTTCHQGNNPREETPVPSSSEDAGFTMRKMVNPETTCLKCHGQHNYKIMNLPGPWEETRDAMGNSCMTCHVAFRTVRHQVTYLNTAEIEKAGQENADFCYGCHGGRSWYRISYPYPRHAWPNMAPDTPDWAKDRPTESEARFRLPSEPKPADKKPADDKPAEKKAADDKAADKKPADDKPADKAADKSKADKG